MNVGLIIFFLASCFVIGGVLLLVYRRGHDDGAKQMREHVIREEQRTGRYL
jgi:hypothetical protein